MDKELELFLSLNIQRFAEEADNEIDDEEEEFEDEEESEGEEPIVDGAGDADGKDGSIDTTKAFSKRLKEKTKELETKYSEEADKKVNERLNEIAKLHGFDSWEKYEDSINKNMMIEAGVDDPEKIEKVIQKMISQNPEVIKAKRIIEQTERDNYNKSIAEQIELINKIDPEINTLEDLSKLENCNEITEKVKMGYKLYDAYVICNLDKIQSAKIASAKQQAKDNYDSKGHLKKSTGKQSTVIDVPEDIYKMYKRNTKMTDDEIKAHYKKSLEG